MLTRKKISIVSVGYNESGSIPELYKRTVAVIKKITPNYEIIFVDDGSVDKSEEILRKLAKKDRHFVGILHSRNFGAQSGFTTGMKIAKGDVVVIMDSDLQDPPELIRDFVEKWLEGNKVVYGVRKKREKSLGRLNEFLYHLFYLLFNKLSYVRMPLDAGDFSLMDREVVDKINALPEKDRFIRGLRAWVGHKQVGVKYTHSERFSGRSKNNFIKNLGWASKAIFSFSYKPLELVSYMAVISFFLSIAAIILYVFLYFAKPDAPRGFLTTLVAILFLGSVQLISMSIIAEYIRRLFEEIKSRPSAIVKEIIKKRG